MLIDEKLALYQAYGVTPLFGGMVFENAFVRGKIDAFVDYVRQKAVAVEISDSMVAVPKDVRLAVITRLRDAGLKAFVEVGRKYAKSPLSVDAMVSDIDDLTQHGVDHIILERGEIDYLLGSRGEINVAVELRELFDRVGRNRIFAEVEK